MVLVEGEFEVIGEFMRRQKAINPKWGRVVGTDIESGLCTIYFDKESNLKPFMIQKVQNGWWDCFIPGFKVPFMRNFKLCEEAIREVNRVGTEKQNRS